MTNFDENTRFKRCTDVVDTDIGGERALLHLQENTYFTINETGTVIWEALAEPSTPNDLVAAVTDAFDVDAATAMPDLERLLTELLDARLIEPVTA